MDQDARLQTDIARILELIQTTNAMIDQLHQAGKESNSLAIRQEERLRRQYASELNTLLSHYRLSVKELAH